jgi:hypothetical protein
MGPLFCYLADSMSEEGGDRDDTEDEYNPPSGGEHRKLSPLNHLERCEKLQKITFSNIDDCYGNEFTWRIPIFKNLRTLVLLGLDRSSYEGNVDDVAEVLLASPGLTSLGISLMPEEGMGNDNLRKMINHYQSRREILGMPILKISELHLGLGFLPVEPQWPFLEDDYVKDLTDLTALTDLCLENWHITDSVWTVPYYEIHPKLFSRATRLTKILVERLSPDIVELIDMIKNSSSDSRSLTEIEVSRYFETVKPNEEGPYNELFVGKPLYSLPLEQTGLHWRKVTYGTKLNGDGQNMAEHLLQNFVAQCAELEELTIPMSHGHLEFFKSFIMPKARRLHTLMLPREYIADLEVLWHSPAKLEQMGERKRLEYIGEHQKLEREHEERRIDLVTDLFALNRRILQENRDVCALRYIGISTHVYCCMLPVLGVFNPPVSFSIEHPASGGTVIVDKFQIMKLSPDQAREFPSVKRLDKDRTNYF